MKALLTFLTIICLCITAKANRVYVGSGSGGFTSSTTYPAGDTICINPGTYNAAITFANVVTNVIIPYGNVTFTLAATRTWQACNGVNMTSFGGYVFKDSALSGSGNYIYGSGNQNIFFNGFIGLNSYNSGTAFLDCTSSNGDYVYYSGTTATLKLYIAAITNSKFTGCNMLFMGDYTAPSNLRNFVDSLVIANDTVQQTATNGWNIGGNITRLDVHKDLITYSGLNTLDDDVGFAYFDGWGYFYDNIYAGGRGYLARDFLYSLSSNPGTSLMFNNLKHDTYKYGMFDVRCDNTAYGSYCTSANFNIFNNTILNCTDTDFIAPLVVVYQMNGGAVGGIFNNFCANLTFSSGGAYITSFDNWIADSSNNIYTQTGALSYLKDTTTTFMPKSSSYLNTNGIAEPLSKPDLYGYTPSGNRIGAIGYNPGGSSNTPPTFGQGTKNTIQLPLDSLRTGNVATQGTCKIGNYSWTQLSGPNTATITNSGLDSSWFKNLIVGTYIFQNTVNDTCGLSASVNDTIIVSSANTSPSFGRGTNNTITLPVDSLRTGNVATQGTCRISVYSWSQVSGPSTATITTGNLDSSWFKNLVAGTYIFQLTASDTCSLSASVNDTIIVHAAAGPCDCVGYTGLLRRVWSGPAYNPDDYEDWQDSLPKCIKPVMSISDDTTVALSLGSIVFTASAIPENGSPISTYVWSQVSGPTATLVNDSTESVTAKFNTVGTYVFQVQATDQCGANNTAQVSLTVNNPTDTVISISPGFEVELYPNPANSVITEIIKGKTDGTVEINIYNLQGRNLATLSEYKSSSSISETLNLSKFSPGTYVIKTTINRSKPVSVKFEIVR